MFGQFLDSPRSGVEFGFDAVTQAQRPVPDLLCGLPGRAKVVDRLVVGETAQNVPRVAVRDRTTSDAFLAALADVLG